MKKKTFTGERPELEGMPGKGVKRVKEDMGKRARERAPAQTGRYALPPLRAAP
ncbi:hypothetical protein GCM10010218_04540 [Streptomyces mashuensis]|uniref:Uncharacterized protein n=1 Tax=Streptomyces mashuensis TaxID=33904 RepID=A0A919AWF8_9ACTN|nr:hypothetical protein GCM10010218_04540 [Streptomyces mashuensis]